MPICVSKILDLILFNFHIDFPMCRMMTEIAIAITLRYGVIPNTDREKYSAIGRRQ